MPDLRINGLLWEVKKSTNSNNLNNVKHAIDEGRKQADHVIVSLSDNLDRHQMLRIAVGRFKDHTNLKIIEFTYKGKYSRFYK